MNKLINLFKNNQQVISYLFWGVLTTVVSIAVYDVLVWISPNPSSFIIGIINMIAGLAGIIFAYFTNRKYVFHSNAHGFKEQLKEFWSFFLGRIATIIIETIFIMIIVKFGVNNYIAKIIGEIFVIVANYFWSKLVVFKNNYK